MFILSSIFNGIEFVGIIGPCDHSWLSKSLSSFHKVKVDRNQEHVHVIFGLNKRKHLFFFFFQNFVVPIKTRFILFIS
jgi:hypothetical protein